MSEKDEQVINITKIDDDTQYWFFRAGRQAKYLGDFYRNKYIGIGDNNIKLSKIEEIKEDLNQITNIEFFNSEKDYEIFFKEQLYEEYKKYIFDELIEIRKDYKKSKFPDDKIEQKITKIEETSISRSASIQASQNFDFIENMKIGDIVLIPEKGTNGFYIGYVNSDIYSEKFISSGDPDIDDLMSKYEKRREIKWIKKISIEDLPDKLYWIKNSHKTIFNISENADSVNNLLSNIYFYKNKLHLILNVKTEKEINSDDWLDFQKSIKTILKDDNKYVFQKQKVQSPGQIFLDALNSNSAKIFAIYIILFAPKVQFKGLELHGLLSKDGGLRPFIDKKEREKRNIESEKRIQKAKNDKEEEDLRAQKLKNDKKKEYLKSLDLDKQIANTNEKVSKLTEKDYSNIKEIKQKFNISNEDVGEKL